MAALKTLHTQRELLPEERSLSCSVLDIQISSSQNELPNVVWMTCASGSVNWRHSFVICEVHFCSMFDENPDQWSRVRLTLKQCPVKRSCPVHVLSVWVCSMF